MAVRLPLSVSGLWTHPLKALIRAGVLVGCLVAGSASLNAVSTSCCPDGAYSAGQLLVGFEAGVGRPRVEEIATRVGAVVLQQFTSLNGYVMGVPAGEEQAYIVRFEIFPEVTYAVPDRISCIPELPACECCPCGVICPDLPACTDPCPGAVPDGHRVPGPPLAIQLLEDGSVTLAWGASCRSEDTDYEVFEGTLGDFRSHAPRLCSTGGATEVTLRPSGSASYFLVVPRNATHEGSYGTGSNRVERPQGASACLPRKTRPCPGACPHDLCTVGAPLAPPCGECAARICEIDPSCCALGWGSDCVSLVRTACGDSRCAAAECEAAGGVWTECGPVHPDCSCPGVICIQMCASECFCLDSGDCPAGMQCVLPSCGGESPGICQ